MDEEGGMGGDKAAAVLSSLCLRLTRKFYGDDDVLLCNLWTLFYRTASELDDI